MHTCKNAVYKFGYKQSPSDALKYKKGSIFFLLTGGSIGLLIIVSDFLKEWLESLKNLNF